MPVQARSFAIERKYRFSSNDYAASLRSACIQMHQHRVRSFFGATNSTSLVLSTFQTFRLLRSINDTLNLKLLKSAIKYMKYWRYTLWYLVCEINVYRGGSAKTYLRCGFFGDLRVQRCNKSCVSKVTTLFNCNNIYKRNENSSYNSAPLFLNSSWERSDDLNYLSIEYFCYSKENIFLPLRSSTVREFGQCTNNNARRS